MTAQEPRAAAALETPARAARRSAPPALRGLRAAFAFASRLPVGGFPYAPSDWHWAPAHLPAVGISVGAASATVFALAAQLGLGRLLGATLAVLTSVWLTGAFHEDGLADSADGLGGAHGGKRALEIMKDSRIGSYGALALGLGLLLRVAAISELPSSGWFALIYVHCWARVGPVWLLASEPRVGDPETSKISTSFSTRPLHVATAIAWAVLCSTLGLALGGLRWQAALGVPLVIAVVTTACARHFRRAVGGVNGDLLGATEQINEMAAWIALLAANAIHVG